MVQEKAEGIGRRIPEIVFILAWGIAAFIIASGSPGSAVYLKLAFNKLMVPLFYWLWAGVGALFLLKILRYDKDNIGDFFIASFLSHLVILMAGLLTVQGIYAEVSKVYLLYILAAMFAFSFFSVFWAYSRSSQGNGAGYAVLIVPVIVFLAALHGMFYAKTGAVIFASALSAGTAAFFVKQLKGSLVSAAEKVSGFLSSEKNAPVLIFLTAFLLRLAFSFILIHKTGDTYPFASDDGSAYDSIAVQIVSASGGVVKILSQLIWPPMYVLMVSAVYKLFGQNFYALTILQSMLGACVALGAYIIAKNIAGKRPGVIAGFLIAFNQPLIFISSVIGTEALSIPLTVAGFILLYPVLRSENNAGPAGYIQCAAAGALFGLAGMTFGSLLYFTPIIAVFLLFLRHKKISRRILSAFIFTAFFLSVVFSVKFLYFSETNTWTAKYEENGRNQYFIKSMFGYDKDPDNREFVEMGITPYDIGKSLGIAVQNMPKCLEIAGRTFPARIRDVFLWKKFGSFDTIFLINSERIENNFSPNLEFYTIIFFFAGIFFLWRNMPKEKAFLYLIVIFLLYYTVIHGLIFIPHRMRYVAVMKPFLAVFLSAGIAGLFLAKHSSSRITPR